MSEQQFPYTVALEAVDAVEDDMIDAANTLTPTFVVQDEASADWVVGQITRRNDELARIKAQYDARVKRLENELAFFDSRFRQQLVDWTQVQLTGKRKSVDLPHGRVGFRHVNERLEVVEENAAIDAARTAVPEAVKVKTYLSLTALKEYWKQTGEVLEGCGVVPSEERFYVQ